jgi:hypothetical protein
VPPDAGLPETNLRVDRYSGKKLFSGHGGTVTLSLGPYLDSVRIPATGVFHPIALGGRKVGAKWA